MTKFEKLMSELENNEIANPRETLEDLLKLAGLDQFRREWHKHNYILRNIERKRIINKGLRPVRSETEVTLLKNMKYTRIDMANDLNNVMNRLIKNTEFMLMREMCTQIRNIVNLDIAYVDYFIGLTNISDKVLLETIFEFSPEELQEGVSIELNNSWQWLPFPHDKIMTTKYATDNHEVLNLYMINNVTFVFDHKFLIKILEKLKDVRCPIDKWYDPLGFKEITESKRQD